MKKVNLIEWLSRNSHEKQKPQRFARYAAMLIMLLTLGVGPMWAKRIYLDLNGQNWTDASALIYVHEWEGGTGSTWPGHKMTHKGGNIYYYDIDDNNTKVKFSRVNPNNTSDVWNSTADLTFGSNNIYTLSEYTTGSWSSTLATWIGKSYIVANGTWYNADGTGQANNFNSYNLGAITSLSLGGQVQTYGQKWGDENNAEMYYKIDENSSSTIELEWFKYADNNNFYGMGGTGSQHVQDATNINISALEPGSHSLAVWFHTSDGDLWDSNNSSNYIASFTINPIVTFDANGGSGSMSDQTVTYNTNTALSANSFTKTGYDFAGWATSSDGSVVYANQGNVQLTAHTDLYAKWTAHNYTASNNIKHADGSTAGQYNVNYDATSISYTTAPSKTGYNLEGLYYESGLSNKIVNNDRSLRASTSYTTSGSKWNQTSAPNLYAKWTAKTYSITLNDDGAYDGDGSATATYNGTALAISEHASRDGWNLVGYFAAGTGDQVTDASGNLLPSKRFQSGGNYYDITNSSSQWIYDGDLTLYAHWSKEYSVTYNANGGTGTTTDANSPYEAGSNVTVLSNSFTRSGYSFTGWNTSAEGDGTPYAAGATISSIAANVTLYAQWSENDYTVTVNAGSNGSVGSGSVTGHKDTKVTLPTATANTGYHFSTWTTTSGSVTYTDQTSATAAQVNGLTAAATVRADFAANTYSVVFNANGGSGSMSNEAFTYDAASKALTSNSFTKSGYTFVGWATSAARANAMNIDYTNGQSVQNLTSMNGGTFNLYAVWAKKYYIGGRFQHDWEDGSSTTNEMTYDTSTGKYKFTTSKTVSELSAQWHNVSGNYDADQVFFIHTGNGKNGSSSPFYTTPNQDGAGRNFETSNSYANALVLAIQETNWGEIVNDRCVQFSNVDNLSSSVIVWWDPANKKVWYTATESLNTNYYLLGFGEGSWGETDARRFKVASVNATTATVSVSLSATTYTQNTDNGFKVKHHNGTYYGNNSTMTRANCSGWVFEDGKQNCGITADLAGTYTFTLNLSTMAVTATYPTAYQLNYSIGSVAGTDGSISTSPSTSSGSYVGSGNSVTLTGPEAKTGYTWKGWYTNAAGTEGKIADESRAITVTMNADKTLYACYTENSYSTNVAVSPAAKGSITDPTPAAGKIDVSHHTGTSVTATAITNYVFDHWGVSGGGLTVNSTTANPATFKATSANGTITAYFEDQWCIKGDQWDSWSTSKGLPNTGTNTYSASFTLTKGQKYKFKVHDRKTNTWYGNTKDAGEHAMERGDAAYGTATNGGNDDNLTITPDVTGDYTFSFNTSTKKITVTYPTAYTVTFGAGTINGSDAAISASATPSFSSGDYVLPETDITFSKGSTKDGYTWKGWYSDQAGSATLHEDDDDDFTWSATRTGNISVYACYNFITYDITYNLNSGTNHPSNPATFNVETSTITLQNPTRTGYTFGGWYDNSSLTGDAVTTIAKGTHEDQEFWAKWTAKTYTITLNQNGATTESDPTSLTATYDGRAGGTSDQFTLTNPEKTGYTFAGWYESEGGTGAEIITTARYYKWEANPYVTTTGLWQHDGNVTVYAKWTPNDYAVTLSTTGETGYGSNAPANQTATFGAGLPTITPPTGAAGYKFQGYFTAANGAGTQYYNANGTSAHAWDIASGTTLHAYFQKTVISTLEHPASIAKGDVVTLDVNPVLNQTGATDYMDICWSLLYDNDNPVESGVAIAANPVDGKPNQVRYTLTGLSAGYYKVKAVLKANASSFDACDAGTELSTLKSNLRIAGNSNVTILYQDASGNTIRENGAVEVARGETVEVTAPEIIGYSFATWVLGDVLATEDELTANPITISAEYDGHLTAKYNRKNTIYFKNTLNWPAVYVNLLDAGYWNENGSGNNGHSNRNLEMTRLGESDIWYYEYDGKTANAYVSFTSVVQNGDGAGAGNFWGADTEVENEKVKVVYPTRPNYDANERTAYGFHVNTPMFVPLAGQTAKEMNVNAEGRAYYYNQGYWTKYEPVSKETGYTLKIFNKKNNAAEPDAGSAPVLVKSVPFVFDGDMTFPVSVTVDLEAGKWYGFKLYRDKGNSSDPLSWYGNGGNMSNKHSGDFSKGETVWEFKTTLTDNCGLQTNSAGDYVFTLTYGKEAYKDSMQYLIGVHYPEATGDYRLVYSDNNRTGILSTTIPFESEADTLSFFVDKTASPKLALQKCEVSYDGKETTTLTWTDTIADLFSSGLPSAITESGVYYFCINKNPETGKKELGDTKLYEGNFYIRTDGATPSKWDNFRQNNHLMAYSDYADEHENFTHSYTQWYDLTNRKNLKFTVANDYSVSISDTLTREALSGQWTNIDDYIDENGDLNRQANVRFMYNSKTNAISRAYIDGAYADGGNFLKILARTQDSIYAAAEGGDPLTEITFTDNGNWLYEQTVFAQPGARYKLRSLFGTTDGGKQVITQYFKGGAGSTAADSATMIGGDGSSRMQIRLLYDFKTNRVVTAYQPSGTIDESVEIHADIMFMREHQEDIEQITFAEGKSISEIENIYCGLRFNKWTLNNKSKEDGHATLSPLLSRYERDIFYVSFPYDVRLSDVIGFGTYGQHWIVEYYDGAARAKNGFWIDSDSYWKFVTPSMKDTFTLKAGTGYIVALDLDELYYISDEVHASIWDNTDITNLELLFPGKVSSISNVDVTYNMPSHECTINRGTTAGNRTIKDSHWNVLGVPTFKNITGQASGDPDEGVGRGEIVFANKAWVKDSLKLKFIYDGNLADNSLTPKAVKDFEFKAMHAYVVQYCGDVTFTTSATPAPASVAARTYAEEPIDVDFRLELNKDGVLEDQTFVSMTNNEDASADFVFGEDLSKEFNTNRANIYTFIGTEWVAGNTLPMTNQTTIVPVGVKIAADGEYTFSIPEGTYGVGITLIDNEAGARTNLGLMDYSVTLEQGQIDNRFVLEISPISQISTDIEAVTGDGLQVTGARKIMIDGLLYIVKDGKVFDAQGKRLQ